MVPTPAKEYNNDAGDLRKTFWRHYTLPADTKKENSALATLTSNLAAANLVQLV
jgi:hypothetical protein